jgi:dihydrofolate reductase
MGKIVSNFFISLDGVVESPDQWHFPYFNDEMGAAVGAGMDRAAAFLMGRVLYEQWSDYWTANPDVDPFAGFITNISKFVISDSLGEATWTNTTLLRAAEAKERLTELKQTLDGDIGMSGSATTVRWLLAEGLLDELNLLVHPIVVGHGQRLFENTPSYPLRLVENTVFGTGVLHSVYAPAG